MLEEQNCAAPSQRVMGGRGEAEAVLVREPTLTLHADNDSKG
jgi:hypothetical protein